MPACCKALTPPVNSYVEGWQRWQKGLLPIKGSLHHAENMYQISAAVMRTHESKQFPGGIVASLAIPWGASKGG